MSRKTEITKAKAEGVAEGWQKCLDAVMAERARGLTDGKECAYLDDGARLVGVEG